MLDQNIKAQLKAYLERLESPIELVAALDDSDKAEKVKELVTEIAELSDRVTARFDGDNTRRPSFGVAKAGEQPRVFFAGLPMGHEFTSLILALLQVSGYAPKVSDELLAQIKDSGHRPLIFSQFTKVFPHIEKLMEEQEMTAYKLTGSTPIKDRLSMVQAFNAGSRDAFLVSLKAGGVGLNLTSADVVILVDLWWNPAVEEQAIARAHRMGQKNTVEVIRLITKGTIEEKIMEIQERKKDLIANVLEGDTVDKVLSEAEIREILGV